MPLYSLTCRVPGGPRRQPIPLQQDDVGHPTLCQVIDGLASHAASPDHHHVCGNREQLAGPFPSGATVLQSLLIGDILFRCLAWCSAEKPDPSPGQCGLERRGYLEQAPKVGHGGLDLQRQEREKSIQLTPFFKKMDLSPVHKEHLRRLQPWAGKDEKQVAKNLAGTESFRTTTKAYVFKRSP